MRQILLLATAMAVGSVGPVFAADYAFVINNRSSGALVDVVVQGGQVADFKRVAPGSQRELTISVPDQACRTRVTLVFDDSENLVVDDYDVCENGGLTID